MVAVSRTWPFMIQSTVRTSVWLAAPATNQLAPLSGIMTTSRLHAIAAKLPAPVRSLAGAIWSAARVWIERRRYRFSYSQEFYEQGYHDKLASVGGDRLDFWEAEGYRDRLMAVCDALD